MERIILILSTVSLALFFNLVPESKAQSKDNILILADEWAPMHQLAVLIDRDAAYQIDSADQCDLPADLSFYTYIFMYVHKTLEDQVEVALINYAMNGGRLIVLHHGLASAKMKNQDWLDFMGIELFPGDHPQYPWKVLADTTYIVVNLRPDHFITRHEIEYEHTVVFESSYKKVAKGSYQAFDLLNTEIFLNQRFTDGSKKTILFGFSTENGDIMQPTGGWYKRAGDGWLFYYQAGHRAEDFSNANFLQVIRNTLLWKPE